MKNLLHVYMACLVLFNSGCESEPEPEKNTDLPENRFEQLQKQGDIQGSLNPFELIEHPAYTPVHEINYINDEELVFITSACGYVQVFPYRSMYVEVVNEIAHGTYMAITFCPITRSGISWNRIVGEDTLLLTASGYLYRDNLMPLDLNSGSIWSQMLLSGFSGKHNMQEAGTFPLIETTWRTVKEFFPGAGVYVNKSLLKLAAAKLPGQEMGIISRKNVELFTLDMFPEEVSLISTVVNPGGRVIVAGSAKNSYMVAFLSSYEMEAVEGEFPVIMQDETGTRWNVFGQAVSGERGGEQLNSPVFYSAADWAWRDLYDNVSYYKSPGI